MHESMTSARQESSCHWPMWQQRRAWLQLDTRSVQDLLRPFSSHRPQIFAIIIVDMTDKSIATVIARLWATAPTPSPTSPKPPTMQRPAVI
eukprot:5412246-Pleurochrysis_carterae.AAC.1